MTFIRNAKKCQVSKKVSKTRWVLTWKMVDGKTCVKARLAAEGSKIPIYKRDVWISQVASVFAHLTFRLFLLVQSRGGEFGVETSRTRNRKQMDLIATFFRYRRMSGIRHARSEFGKRSQLHMD